LIYFHVTSYFEVDMKKEEERNLERICPTCGRPLDLQPVKPTDNDQKKKRKYAVILKWSAFLALAGAVVIGSGLLARFWPRNSVAEKICANKFFLMDESGKPRAILEITANGPRLVMCDETGKPRIGMGVDKDGPKLDMTGVNGKPGAMLRMNKDGPMLGMCDEVGKLRLGMGVAGSGPGMAMADETGKPRIGIEVNKNGPRLALSDQAGKPRVAMDVAKDGSRLEISDQAAKSRVAMGEDKDGSMLAMSDETGKYRTTLRMNKNEAKLDLSDELKKTQLKNFTFLMTAPAKPDDSRKVAVLSDYFSVKRPMADCPRILTNHPVIDGKLDENCWRKAGVIADFKNMDTGMSAVYQTKAFILYDTNNIYIGITCTEPQTKLMQAVVTNRDGSIWNENEVEIFFDIKRQGKRLRQFAVNSIGTQCDLQYDNGTEDMRWNSSWIAKTSVQSRSWTAEMAIPLADLDAVPPLPNDIWGINICRVRCVNKNKKEVPKPDEYSCFSPTFGGFFKPERFGDLIFK
jgi:hypothetical protein